MAGDSRLIWRPISEKTSPGSVEETASPTRRAWCSIGIVFGPWREIGCERGPQLMRSVPGVIGPGHHSMVADPAGIDYVVYHAWNKAMTDDASNAVRRLTASHGSRARTVRLTSE